MNDCVATELAQTHCKQKGALIRGGHSFKKHLSVEMLNRGGRSFDGGALLEKYGGVGF